MIDCSGWQARISPRMFLKIQHKHMGKRWMDPPPWQARIMQLFVVLYFTEGIQQEVFHIKDQSAL